MQQNPSAQLSVAEIDHELKHLKKREQVSGLVAFVAAAFAVIMVTGMLAGGGVIVGALAAIALFSSVYSHCCRLAENSLRGKQVNNWTVSPSAEKKSSEESNPLLSFFSLGK